MIFGPSEIRHRQQPSSMKSHQNKEELATEQKFSRASWPKLENSFWKFQPKLFSSSFLCYEEEVEEEASNVARLHAP